MRIVQFDRVNQTTELVNLPSMTEEQARTVCVALNQAFPVDYPLVWKSVSDSYKVDCCKDEPIQPISSEAWKALEYLPDTLANLFDRIETLEKNSRSDDCRLGY